VRDMDYGHNGNMEKVWGKFVEFYIAQEWSSYLIIVSQRSQILWILIFAWSLWLKLAHISMCRAVIYNTGYQLLQQLQ